MNTVTLNDSALMAAFYQRELSAFDELVKRWDRPLRASLVRRGVREADLDDIAQEVWIQVYVSRDALPRHGRFDTGREFRPWFFTLAYNYRASLVRSRTARPACPLKDHDPAAVPASEPTEFYAAVRDCAEQLQEKERYFVYHWEETLGELSQKEIAEALEVSNATVTRYKDRALRQVADCLKRKGYAEV